jgi:tetratricopeptide (TPR) repeat protein
MRDYTENMRIPSAQCLTTTFCVLVFVFIVFLLSSNCTNAQATDSGEQYQQAQRAMAAGSYDEAEQAYERLSRLQPNVAEIRANLGLIYFEQRKFEQAVPELRRALKLKPTLTKSATVLAMSLSELGQYSEALPGLERGFRSSDPEIKRMCGLQLERAYTGLKRDRDAVEVALQLDRSYSRDPEVLYHNGKIFGNFAFLSMRRLQDVAPQSVWKHLALAEAYESRGSDDLAATEYRQVLAMNPTRPGVHYRLGRALLARSRQRQSAEDAAEARKEFLAELQRDPSNANAAYEIGEEHRKAGEFEDAQKFFQLALSHYPDFEEAQVGLAATMIALHQPEQALALLQKAVVLAPDDEVAWFRLMHVYGATGNTAEQQRALTKYERLHREAQKRADLGPIAVPSEVTKQEVDEKQPQ